MNENNSNQNSENEQQSENKPQDGVSQLKEIGLKEVSNKTFITEANLTALFDKEFSKINKTKALGFIQILEREFGVDLEALKEEYRQFDNSIKKSSKNEIPTVEKEPFELEKIKKMLIYLILAAAVVFALYALSSRSSDDTSIVPVDLNVVKNDVVTNQAEESLLAIDENYEKETNQSDEIDLNKVVKEMFHETDQNQSDILNDTNDTNESNSSLAVTEENITAALAPAVEENISLPQTKKELKNIVKPKPEMAKNKNKRGLYIVPVKKAWVGVIFLDTMKKKDFLIRKTLMLDESKDQIILVGHRNFKIFNKRLEQGFKSKKMVRFLYKDGDLREISKKEYVKLRGTTKW